jgi:hypothetical protein
VRQRHQHFKIVVEGHDANSVSGEGGRVPQVYAVVEEPNDETHYNAQVYIAGGASAALARLVPWDHRPDRSA